MILDSKRIDLLGSVVTSWRHRLRDHFDYGRL